MRKKTKINAVGIIVGLLFLGLVVFLFKASQTKNSSGLFQGIVLLGGIGLLFIFLSLKGKSTSSIFNTDVGSSMGLEKGADMGAYLKLVMWSFFKSLLIIFPILVFLQIHYKSSEINSLDNKIACMLHYNCVKKDSYESMTFKPYDERARNYTSDNYKFFFTYPTSWQVNYRKNTEVTKQNKVHWDFKINPIQSPSKGASDISGPADMYIDLIYPSYYRIDYYIEDILKLDPKIVTWEEKKMEEKKWYYLSKGPTGFIPHYMIAEWLGGHTTAAYVIGFTNTEKEVENKIIKYLLNYGLARFW
ncbi:hypothetical protein HYU96_02730 [Candidatus Daviesbacteria bacterium]|nr:hypothetical protein [Candidatus Daviesbacteria bacterium]